MILCLPFFSGDEPLAFKNIQWIEALDKTIDAEVLLSYDTTTNPTRIAEVAGRVFRKVHQFLYNPPPTRKWPQASNWAFQETAWHVFGTFKDSWLWVESDCVPLKAGWFDAIRQCHEAGGKPFTGHWNHSTGVWNGVSVYPYNVPDYGQNLTLVRNNPWDVWASKDVFPHLNIANHLFQHIWQDDQTGQAWSFPDMETVKHVIRNGCVLFHRSKDGSLIDRLSGVAGKEVSHVTQFVHGGDTGDLIYALPTMKSLGDGELLLVPHAVREPFNERKVEMLASLLELQPYLAEVKWTEQIPERAYNFNRFRRFYKKGKPLALTQAELFGRDASVYQAPWLTVDRTVKAGDFKVILHRSGRYHNPAFPWKQVVQQYGKHALFVGIEKEWRMFTKEFGAVEYHRTADFLELARLIAGAKLFVGNQSAPYSIAEGLKQNAVLEAHPSTMDCQFSRSNLWNDPNLQQLPELESL